MTTTKKLTKKEQRIEDQKSQDFISAIESIAKSKGLDISEVQDALKEAFEKTFRNKFDLEANLETNIDIKEGKIEMFNLKTVVETIEDDYGEISINDPEVKFQELSVGDTYKEPVVVSEISRSSAQQIKLLLIQKTKETEKQKIFEKFMEKKQDLIRTKVRKYERSHAILEYEGTSLYMPSTEMNPNETLKIDEIIKVYIVNIEKMSKDSQFVVSRKHPFLVKRIMEEEIRDIEDGIVEIVSVAREAGIKTKVIVKSNTPEVDPVGSCIGVRGSIIKGIIEQISGERIDVIAYTEDPIAQIANCLAPAVIKSVMITEKIFELDEDRWYTDEDGEVVKSKKYKQATVVVPDDQNLIAIGKRGVNAKLTARITRTKIDIKTIAEATAEGIEFEENVVSSEQHNKKRSDLPVETIELDIKQDHEFDDQEEYLNLSEMKEFDKYDEFPKAKPKDLPIQTEEDDEPIDIFDKEELIELESEEEMDSYADIDDEYEDYE